MNSSLKIKVMEAFHGKRIFLYEKHPDKSETRGSFKIK